MAHAYDTFAAVYDLQPTALDDVPFYVDLARRTGGPVLELAVGTGRVALAVARAGIEVVGIDASAAMLQVLRDKLAAEPHLPVTVVEADMRDFDVHDRDPFALAYCPFRAFLHLMTPAEQLAALRTVRSHLRDGGLFAGNIFFPSVALLQQFSCAPAWRRDDEYALPDGELRVILSSLNRADTRAQRIDVTFRYDYIGPDGAVARSETRELSLSYLWPRELEHLLVRAGFELEALHGDFEGTPFEVAGDELVWVARRA